MLNETDDRTDEAEKEAMVLVERPLKSEKSETRMERAPGQPLEQLSSIRRNEKEGRDHVAQGVDGA